MIDRDKFMIGQTEKHSLIKKANRVYFSSGFGFFSAHNGIRPGCLHMILGTTGSGKSTLVRSILLDLLKNENARVLIYLSEESRDDLKTEMARTDIEFNGDANIWLISEQNTDEPITDKKSFFNRTNALVWEHDINVLIFDNITTSIVYNDNTTKEQGVFVSELKSFTSSNKIATILIAHTGATVSDNFGGLINENNIRGSKTITNTVEFLYIMQRFEFDGEFFPTIRIQKHRKQSPSSKLYLLTYNHKTRLYSKDSPISFEKFKEAYSARNKL